MLNFDEDEIVQLKLKGEEYKVAIPNNAQIKKYQSELETEKDKEEVLVEFLENLGLPKKAYESMTPSQTKRLLESLYDNEKN